MDAPDRVKLEAAIVQAVAANVTDLMEGEWGDRQWAHLFVDFEIAPDGERSSSISFVLAHFPGKPLEKLSFRLPREAKRLLATLADDMGARPDGRWSSAQIRVSRDGRYAMDYAYAPPYRLGGNLLDKRFEDYLDTWLQTEEGAPYRPRRTGWRAWLGR